MNTPEYRFAPPSYRDEPRVVCMCAWCGGEVYVGDSVTRVYDLAETPIHEACEYAWIESCVIKERGVIDADGLVE